MTRLRKFIFIFFVLFSSACMERCDGLPTSPSSFGGGGSVKMWLAPNIGSKDFVDMFKRPEEWAEARSRVNVFQFYSGNIATVSCSICGSNNFMAFMNAVPGGAFKWLNDNGIEISIEAGSVQFHQCGNLPDDTLRATTDSIFRIQATGASVSYVAMDSPFTGAHHCTTGSRDVRETVALTKYYVDNLKRRFPKIKVGLIDPYPSWSVVELKEFLTESKNGGLIFSFFHLDLHRRGGLASHNIPADVEELKTFSNQLGIPFGVIIWGDDGSSNQAFSADLLNTAALISSRLAPDVVIVQSWSDDKTTSVDTRLYPDNIPESQPMTLTWLFNEVMKIFRLK